MVQYTYDYTIGEGFGERLGQITTSIKTSLDDLDVKVRGALHLWDGAARDAYNAAKAEWDAAAARMPEALGRAQQSLMSIHEGYGSADNYAKSSWGG
ncbi:MAG: WXG100 family type VII secretion target [Kibdelosporangium sp.]